MLNHTGPAVRVLQRSQWTEHLNDRLSIDVRTYSPPWMSLDRITSSATNGHISSLEF